MTSAYVESLIGIASDEYQSYHTYKQNDSPLASRIKQYWEDLGIPFPGIETAWSAVFVSWCVQQAGATSDDFRFDQQHSVFVHASINNRYNNWGVFRAYRLTEYKPQIGDIIHNNRPGLDYDYEYATANAHYSSHTGILVRSDFDAYGDHLVRIGGNESNSIREKKIYLDENGYVRKVEKEPFISVIQDLK